MASVASQRCFFTKNCIFVCVYVCMCVCVCVCVCVVLHPAYRSTDVHEDTPISSNILYDTHFLLYTPFSAVPSAIEKHFCATVLYYTTLH